MQLIFKEKINLCSKTTLLRFALIDNNHFRKSAKSIAHKEF